MTALLIIGFIMVLVGILFTYLELLPFIDALQAESRLCSTVVLKVTLPWRLLRHVPKLIPSIIDLGCLTFLSTFLGIGGGIIGGVTGVFASNVISIVIYWHTHLRRAPAARG